MFWKDVFQLVDKYTGQPKYKNLPLLVKNCLSLSHGNSDVERGFSLNCNILSDNRQILSESCIIGIRHVKYAVRRKGNICAMPIREKLLNSVAKSHSAYIVEKVRKIRRKIYKRKEH